MASTTATSDLDIALLSRSPYKAILRLATPTVIAMLSQSAVNEIDVLFFARLPWPESSNAQAALAPSLLIVWLFGGTLGAVSVGAQALTARRHAERNYDAAGAVLTNAVFFCLVAGPVLMGLGAVVMPLLVKSVLKVQEAQDTAIAYSRWRLLGIMSIGMTMAFKGFFDGLGRTTLHLVSAIVMNAFNVLFCWMFIFGNLGAPRMGAPGAGFAALVSTWIGLFIMMWFGWKARDAYKPIRWSNVSRGLVWDILKLSIPAAIATSTMMFGFGLFLKIVGKLDAAAADLSDGVPDEAINGAATTDIIAVLKLTFTACIGFGTSTATLVGQSLGAKRPEEAAKFGWASVRLGLVIFGVVGLCEGVFFTKEIVHFISHSDAVRAITMTPMRMMGVVTPIIAVAMILSEALFGAGNTRYVAGAQLVLIFGGLVPIAWLLGIKSGLGLNGIWAAACVYAALAAIAMSVKFRAGGWKQIKL
jgi:putative MATE family efflux protein